MLSKQQFYLFISQMMIFKNKAMNFMTCLAKWPPIALRRLNFEVKINSFSLNLGSNKGISDISKFSNLYLNKGKIPLFVFPYLDLPLYKKLSCRKYKRNKKRTWSTKYKKIILRRSIFCTQYFANMYLYLYFFVLSCIMADCTLYFVRGQNPFLYLFFVDP